MSCNRVALALCAAVSSACVLPRPDAKLPTSPDTSYVAVLSGEMPPPIDMVARHAWVIAHVPGLSDRRFEYGASGGPGAFDDFTGGDVMLHGVVEGTRDEIKDKIVCLEKASTDARESHPDYFPIPGPNSNTYVDILIRNCHLGIELPATAIGRDYRGIVGASVTESGTGVQFESVLFGLRLGLLDGVEVHLLSFVLGVHFWPPGITLPVNPGRIGFASDGHVARPHQIDRDASHGEVEDRKYGLATADLFASVARPIDPSKMGGLEGRSTVGFIGRALYGKTIGYGFGFDFELGAGYPTSFAYSVHLDPIGVGVMFGQTGYFGIFAGVGTSGLTSLVPPALEIPVESRLELDVTRYARIGFRASAEWNAGPSERQHSALAGNAIHELSFGAFVRMGKTRQYERQGYLGSGYFIGVERRELMGSAWLGLTLGVETDAAW